MAELPASGPGSLLHGAGGDLLVDLQLSSTDAATFAAIDAAGAKVVSRTDGDQVATVSVAPTDLGALGSAHGVRWAQEVLTPMVGGVARPGRPARPASPARAAASCSARKISEGDAQIRASNARTTYGVDGAGTTVGVLSDSFYRLGAAPTDVANGELPGPGNPCGRTTPVTVQSEMVGSGASDEGRAMTQIVHDVAPGATLRFASAFNGAGDFADQIRNLATNGASVIVDDISYFDEPIYQDGIIAKAVDDVAATGVAYYSSAGNSNIVVGGKEVGSYEAAAYRPTTCPAAIASLSATYTCHDFDPSAGVSGGDDITLPSSGEIFVKLGWNEPAYGLSTNLDVFLVDNVTGAIKASSAINNPGGSNQALELMSATNSGSARSYKLVVARKGGTATPRFKAILLDLYDPDPFDGSPLTVQWNTSSGTDVIGPTAYGHNLMGAGAGVAAVPYDDASTVEEFSSRGPATYCWDPIVGTVPAGARAGGCLTKQLDVAATDGVVTTVTSLGLNPFYGTSAAAPHAAGAAALLRQARPCATGAQVIQAQRATGRAVGSFGVAAVGSGLVTTDAAIAATAACPTVPGPPTGITATAGNAQATVSWTAPAANGGSAITGYKVTPFIGVTPQAVRSFSGAGTSGVVTGLTNGTTYTFKVAAVNANGTGALSGASPSVTPVAPPVPGAVYVPITPCRVLDTRFATAGRFAVGEQRSYQVAGSGITGQGGASSCVPDGALAVEASVTAVSPDGSGYFRAWPSNASAPNATFLNFTKVPGITNTGSLSLAPTGTQDLTVKNFGATSHYVVDVQGYFVLPGSVPSGLTGAVYVPITPCRVLDTRFATAGRLAVGEQRSYQVAGSGITGQGGASSCVPDGAVAVEASVTAASPDGSGYFRAWPSNASAPNATFLNFTKVPGITNTGSLALAPSGTQDLTVKNFGATSHYVVDVQGYFVLPGNVPSGLTGATYVPITPCRVLDTRFASAGRFAVGEQRSYQVAGTGIAGQGGAASCVPDGAVAVESSVTAVSPDGSGYLRAWPSNASAPNATFLNFTKVPGITNTGSLSLAPTGTNDLTVKDFGATSHYVVDVQGYFQLAAS
ncbi:fibronectin type III domain-containing protein [Aquihabitans sp. G128]|nr:fibronectin type III domain-containing protein [Aquihabitans sp. G128]